MAIACELKDLRTNKQRLSELPLIGHFGLIVNSGFVLVNNQDKVSVSLLQPYQWYFSYYIYSAVVACMLDNSCLIYSSN